MLNDESKQHIKELWEKGVTAEKIGRLYGVSKNTIIGMVHRAKWKREEPDNVIKLPSKAKTNPHTPLFNERLARLHANMDAVLAIPIKRLKAKGEA